jgi:hypothetical protein
MVGTGDPFLGKNDPSELAKAALHPVSSDGVADLLRHGEAEAKHGIAIVARADEKDEARHGRAPAAVRGEEVRAAGELDYRRRC